MKQTRNVEHHHNIYLKATRKVRSPLNWLPIKTAIKFQ